MLQISRAGKSYSKRALEVGEKNKKNSSVQVIENYSVLYQNRGPVSRFSSVLFALSFSKFFTSFISDSEFKSDRKRTTN